MYRYSNTFGFRRPSRLSLTKGRYKSSLYRKKLSAVRKPSVYIVDTSDDESVEPVRKVPWNTAKLKLGLNSSFAAGKHLPIKDWLKNQSGLETSCQQDLSPQSTNLEQALITIHGSSSESCESSTKNIGNHVKTEVSTTDKESCKSVNLSTSYPVTRKSSHSNGDVEKKEPDLQSNPHIQVSEIEKSTIATSDKDFRVSEIESADVSGKLSDFSLNPLPDLEKNDGLKSLEESDEKSDEVSTLSLSDLSENPLESDAEVPSKQYIIDLLNELYKDEWKKCDQEKLFRSEAKPKRPPKIGRAVQTERKCLNDSDDLINRRRICGARRAVIFDSSSENESQTVEDKFIAKSRKSVVIVPKAPIKFSFLASLSNSIENNLCDLQALLYRTDFKKRKEDLTRHLFQLYNREIFENRLPKDMIIEWNVRLTKTAGLCRNERKHCSGTVVYKSRIELSVKVLDTAERLRDTLLHELCHAAVWLLEHTSGKHGPLWLNWTQKAKQRFPELPRVRVSHTYAIATKYTYKCESCGTSFGRHTKSLNLEKFRCGRCRGHLKVYINKTNKMGENEMQLARTAPQTPFAAFVKQNYGSVKKDSKARHGQVMKILSEQFAAIKVTQACEMMPDTV